VKGHDGIQGNKGSDELAKREANKNYPDPMNLDIPDEFDIQGARLSTLTQATAYRGILEQKQPEIRQTTKRNVQLTCIAIKRITSKLETDSAIWNNTRKKTVRLLIQQFLYKIIHGTHMVRKYQRNINGYEERKTCMACNKMESMSHILMQYKEKSTQLIWHLTKNIWPHRNIPWPDITLEMILGCRSICMHLTWPERCDHQRRQSIAHRGPTRLFQILILESAYLIWTLRCE
jgi:hypothetical protein